MQPSTEWNLTATVEQGIKARLNRAVLLDHLSAIELEQLNALLKPGYASDDYLSNALNRMLDV